LAVLPCFLADLEPTLVRVLPPDAGLTSGLWLLTHRDLRETARIHAFMDFIAQSIRSQKPLLEGKGSITGTRKRERSTSR
jgi:DNA-binding transcriptional LysR family regulator